MKSNCSLCSCLDSSLSFLQMLQSCNLSLNKTFFLSHCRPACPFLRLFVSQLEHTRRLTPTNNNHTQIQQDGRKEGREEEREGEGQEGKKEGKELKKERVRKVSRLN